MCSLHGLGFRDVQWTAGFWGTASRFQLSREVIVPTMGKLMAAKPKACSFMGNLLVAAGLIVEGKHHADPSGTMVIFSNGSKPPPPSSPSTPIRRRMR